MNRARWYHLLTFVVAAFAIVLQLWLMIGLAAGAVRLDRAVADRPAP